jgi:hypothetical protein
MKYPFAVLFLALLGSVAHAQDTTVTTTNGSSTVTTMSDGTQYATYCGQSNDKMTCATAQLSHREILHYNHKEYDSNRKRFCADNNLNGKACEKTFGKFKGSKYDTNQEYVNYVAPVVPIVPKFLFLVH